MYHGMNVKLQRIKCGLKQYELAKRVGISPQYLRLIENGTADNVSRKTMLKISEELNCSVDELFFNNKEEK